MEENKKLMINIGCGPDGHDDWINIDYGILAFLHKHKWLERIIFQLKLWPKDEQGNVSYDVKWPANLLVRDCKKDLPFEENSIDYIFSSYFFEHIKKHEAVKLLKSCYRCLKPGAVMRIVVPDIDFVVKQYLASEDNIAKVEVINEHFFALGEQKLTPPGVVEKLKNLFVRGHAWLYNYDYLVKILIESGFKKEKIVRCQAREGRVPNLDVLDRHIEESLFIEVEK